MGAIVHQRSIEQRFYLPNLLLLLLYVNTNIKFRLMQNRHPIDLTIQIQCVCVAPSLDTKIYYRFIKLLSYTVWVWWSTFGNTNYYYYFSSLHCIGEFLNYYFEFAKVFHQKQTVADGMDSYVSLVRFKLWAHIASHFRHLINFRKVQFKWFRLSFIKSNTCMHIECFG